MLFRIALVSIVWMNVYGQVQLDEADRVGRVDILVRDSFGKTVDGASVTIRSAGGGPNISTSALSGSYHYGQYIVTIMKPGFKPASQKVTVNEKLKSVLVGLIPAEIEKSAVSRTVEGAIEQFDRYPECRWIQIVPLFSDTGALQALVSSTGKFRIDGAEPGRYAVLLISDSASYRVSDITILMRDTQSLTVR
jgi:hypothetical protein